MIGHLLRLTPDVRAGEAPRPASVPALPFPELHLAPVEITGPAVFNTEVPMPTKLHPADAADIEKIAQATHFTVHLRSGPHDKITKRARTLAAAIRAADAMGKTASGKKPMVYAVTADDMTVHVPAAMIAQARQEAATARRRAASKATGARPQGRRAAIADNAAKGILPPAPDFSAETHRRFRQARRDRQAGRGR